MTRTAAAGGKAVRHPALLVIDAQIDFLAAPQLTPTRETLLRRTREWLDEFRQRRWPVAHVHTLVRADGSDCMPHWRSHSPIPCIEGSAGAAAAPEVAEQAGEAVFRKRFYSAFGNTDLDAWLAAGGVTELVITGVHTHACILATALDAHARGLRVWIDDHAVASYDASHAAHTLAWMDGRVAHRGPLQVWLDTFAQPAQARRRHADPPCWMHIDPCDGHTVLDQVLLQSTDEIDAAIVRLTGSAPDHRPPSPTERAAALERWARGLRQRADEAASLIVRQVGKPLRDARAEVAYGLALLEASLSQTLADADEGGRMRQRPGGLTAIVTAWNNPFAIPIGKLAPAVGSGNPVVWKPAPAGSAVARWLLQSLAEAGLGAQVMAVWGDARAALALADHPAVARLSFTGSLAGGRALAWRCAARMVPFQGELGGNNAAIVMPDADPDAVAADLAPAMFSFAGQRCTAIRRIIVHRDAHPALSRCLADAVAALSTAAPGAEDTVLGPVISRHKQTSLQGLMQEGLSAGGRVLACGSVGADLPERGFWLPATVLQDVPDDSPLVMDEQFGPVAVVQTARDLDHALALANGTGYGLLAALYSSDANTLERFEADARAGILSINRARPAFDPALPFGGWSGSGMGMPEHGGWGRAFNALPQAVYRHAAPRAPDPHDSASARSSCHSG